MLIEDYGIHDTAAGGWHAFNFHISFWISNRIVTHIGLKPSSFHDEQNIQFCATILRHQIWTNQQIHTYSSRIIHNLIEQFPTTKGIDRVYFHRFTIGIKAKLTARWNFPMDQAKHNMV